VCGIAGLARRDGPPPSVPVLERMAAALYHRGPDGYGLYTGTRVGLAHARLSIIDVEGGAQPLTNEDGAIVVVFNGEIYNYVELRSELRSLGHRFRTSSDTEVLVHGWEEWGEEMLHRLNGQWAFALYDRRDGSLFLARDRFGIQPLFYAQRGGDLIFASEVKALLASGEVDARLDARGLDEVFTFWGAVAPRTVFEGVAQLEPGSCARWRNGELRLRYYYDLEYRPTAIEPADAIEQLDALMRSAVELRMRADVPVGGYLSGGLDSSITCSLAAACTPHELRTFSVTFQDPVLDESGFQRELASDIGSVHSVAHIEGDAIARVFPDVVRHAEAPLVRTAPAPLYLLSRLTQANGIRVVLTGEGADEVFLGYDLFKETVVRHFCLRQPSSTRRPMLFDRLYPYLSPTGGEFWRRFFLEAGDPADPLFSHLPRMQLTSRIRDFYTTGMRASLDDFDAAATLRQRLPADFERWTPLGRAAYLELKTLLASYLISSQGERMAMANSVEGRFPFLDHRLFEFAASLPDRSKLRTLHEKDILRRWARDVVPKRLANRPKQPYRAPDAPAFFGQNEQEYVAEMLSAEAVLKAGVFEPRAVDGLVRRCRAGKATGFRENQALVAILSTQLLHNTFCAGSVQFGDRTPWQRPDVHLTDGVPTDTAVAVSA